MTIKWGRLARVALRNITRNRMRSLLTMLGVIIGVGSVIALLALGRGTQADIQSEIESLGTNMVMVHPGRSRYGGVSRGAGSLNTLKMRDVEALARADGPIREVSPIIRAMEQVIAGRNNWYTTVYGVSPGYLDIRSWSVESGAFFTEQDEKARRKIAVLGATVVDELFGGEDPIGAKIRIRNVPFTVVGVLSRKGQNMMGADQDDVVLVPSMTALYRLGDGETVNSIMVSASSEEQIGQAEQLIREILRKAHRLATGEEDDFDIRSQTEIIDRATSITGTLTVLLGSIAGVSLIVGGIGIMNIMLVSVTERTREIGIRLAVGAREMDILAQFLIEAVIISLCGGIMGVVAGVLAAAAISKGVGSSIVVDPSIVVLAFLVSGGIGVFFGFYPARKAAALDPIIALHYE